MPIIASNNFLEDLAFVLGVAAAVSIVFQALRQPVVVGYLVAGMLVGPYVPFPLFADIGRIHILSELGVILLMFTLGLEFSVRRLAQLAPTAGFITLVQVALLMTVGYEAGRAFGWSELEGIFAGAILAISSTTIVAKAFAEERVDRALRELVFGVALFEDLAAVILLAVLTGVAAGVGLSAQMIAITVVRLALFLAILVGAGLLIVPRAIRWAARFKRDETLVVASVGICFAIAMIADLAGYSVALGAFLAGVLVAESGHAPAIEHLVAPLRDIFGAVFFVSVGMMLDPHVLVTHWIELIVLIAVVMAGKIAGVGLGAMLSGSSTRLAVQAGMAMAQIGEFSFIIAGTGLQHGATGGFLYSLAIAVSAITTFTTPFMIRASDRVGRFIDSHLPQSIGLLQAIYDSWTEQTRSAVQPRRYRGTIAFIMLAMSAVVAVAILFALFGDRIEPMVAVAIGGSLRTADMLVRTTAVVLAAVPCFAIWRGARRLALQIAAGILRAPVPGQAVDQPQQAEAKLLVGMFEIAIIFGAVTLLLAIIGPFLSLLDGLAVLLIALVGLGTAIWRSARHLYALVRDGSLMAQIDSWHGDVQSAYSPVTTVMVAPGSRASGRSLGNLDLHGRTGAMVIAIARTGGGVVLPGASEILNAGDTVALAGSSDAVAAARDLIVAPAHEEAARESLSGAD